MVGKEGDDVGIVIDGWIDRLIEWEEEGEGEKVNEEIEIYIERRRGRMNLSRPGSLLINNFHQFHPSIYYIL